MRLSLLHPAGAEMGPRFGRRSFLQAIFAGAGAVALSELAIGCAGDRASAPVENRGRVRGSVTDEQGTPQAIGRVYLLLATGQNENVYADVDSHGAFDFGSIDVGSYQLRYWAGAQATVPEPNPNPVRITVSANADTVVKFTIALGNPDADVKEIYAGDDFYQEQPFGELNAPVTVKLGTVVCWYNVGRHEHTVDGGPWGQSGVLAEAAEFMWTADRTGTFGYRCAFHAPQMQAMLQVVP